MADGNGQGGGDLILKLLGQVQQLGQTVQRHHRELMGDIGGIATTLEATAAVLRVQDERWRDHEARLKKLEAKIA